MFGMRRYRFYLLVAALTASTIYYLSTRGSWDVADLGQLGQTASKHGPPQQPTVNDVPVVVPPLVPTDDVLKAAEPIRPKVSSRLESLPTSSSKIQSSSTLTRKPTTPTTTGEELLIEEPGVEEDFSDEGEGRYEVEKSIRNVKSSRWKKPSPHFPLAKQEILQLPSGTPQKIPKLQATFGKESPSAKKDRVSRLNIIKESFKHAWTGYKENAMGHDEVRPTSKGFADPFNGWGATLVDTLDTLWIMGMKKDFEAALVEVEKIDFRSSPRKDIPLFETVIRYLGGLLAAHDVTHGEYPILLDKTEQLAEILIGAFDTPNRMPNTFYNWAPSYTLQPHRARSHTTMAELGSLSVEMTRLAQITGKHEYYDAIARITDELEKYQPNTLMPGLWPIKMDASGCKEAQHSDADDDERGASKPVLLDFEEYDINGEEPAILPDIDIPQVAKRAAFDDPTSEGKRIPPLRKTDQEILAAECTPQGLSPVPNAKSQTYGIGGQADSTYEYLPKMHALLRGRTKQYESMYKDATGMIRKKLLFRPMIRDENRTILFASKHELSPGAKDLKKRKITTYEVTHLSCFVGGMFGLGAKLFGIESDLELAKQLTDGCVWAYESMATGIMAESAAVVPCEDLEACEWNTTKWYEALDPRRDERFAAVEAWNQKQATIYERSKSEAIRETAIAADGYTTAEISTEGAIIYERPNFDRWDRIPAVTKSSATTFSKLSPDEENGTEEGDENEDYKTSAPIQFVPKVALSHEKYVKARIQEERLPESYTRIFSPQYGLRPEAIESVFYMWRLTGDDIWRQTGWKMFEAVQRATQTDVANAMVTDVTSVLGGLDDVMESFWLAETLKYFYLLFDEPNTWSLDDWVLNTEAHFLKIQD